MMRLTKIALFFVWIVLVIPFVARADVSSETAVPSLHAAVRISAPLTLCGELVPTDDQQVKERYEKEMLLGLGDRPQIILWMKRSRRYLVPIEKMLKEHGLPEDLKYVAIADTIRGFKEIVDGKHDALPEQAFYLVGSIDEAIEKADKMKSEAA